MRESEDRKAQRAGLFRQATLLGTCKVETLQFLFLTNSTELQAAALLFVQRLHFICSLH